MVDITYEVLESRRGKYANKPTKAEKSIISKLTALGVTFEFQTIIHPYIVDFYLPYKKLVIEVDGKSHDERREYDRKRDWWIKKKGYSVIRIKNEEALTIGLDKLILLLGIKSRPRNIFDYLQD